MAITPSTPNLALKSFWQSKPGWVGAGVLGAATALGIYEWSVIVPWFVSMLQSTVTAVELGLGLAGVGYVIFDPTARSIVSNAYQLVMRGIASIIWELDPIGIEQNYLDGMRVEKAKLDVGVQGCAEAKEVLEKNIGDNNTRIKRDQGLLDQVEKTTSKAKDSISVTAAQFDKQRYLNDIARVMTTNENLKKTLDLTNGLYDMFLQMQQVAEFNIDNLADQIDCDKKERMVIMKTFKSLRPAQRLVQGEPEALKWFNAAREANARQNAEKLGAMKNFAIIGQKYLRNMNLEQGAAAANAQKMLDELKKPLLTVGGSSNIVPMFMPQSQAVAVPVSSSKKPIDPEYLDDLLK